MKKLFIFLAALVLSAGMAHAQLGVVAGGTMSGTSISKDAFMDQVKDVTLFHAGVLYKASLPLGLALQPALTYQMKGASISSSDESAGVVFSSLETRTGYVELNLGLQWGLDLLAFRPYVFAEPFVGYAITGEESQKGKAGTVFIDSDRFNEQLTAAKNKLEYGYGLGVGVEVLSHLQLSVQWFRNMGNLFVNDTIDGQEMWNAVKDTYQDVQGYQGIKLSVAILF